MKNIKEFTMAVLSIFVGETLFCFVFHKNVFIAGTNRLNWNIFITQWEIILAILFSFIFYFIIKAFFPFIFLGKSIIEKTFPGKWKNEYTYRDENGNETTGVEIFEIKNKDEYNTFKKEKVNGRYVYDEKPRFKILNFEFEKENKNKFSFLKKKVGKRWHIYEDYVEKLNSSLIEGEESNDTTVKYTRIE
jgi:hypothetical protein